MLIKKSVVLVHTKIKNNRKAVKNVLKDLIVQIKGWQNLNLAIKVNTPKLQA